MELGYWLEGFWLEGCPTSGMVNNFLALQPETFKPLKFVPKIIAHDPIFFPAISFGVLWF